MWHALLYATNSINLPSGSALPPVFSCPSAKLRGADYSYSPNVQLKNKPGISAAFYASGGVQDGKFRKVTEFRKPADVFFFTEWYQVFCAYGPTDWQWGVTAGIPLSNWHHSGLNAVFLDGHADFVTFKQIPLDKNNSFWTGN
jgi:prepilin-type processing-associated H-X9-DG protein